MIVPLSGSGESDGKERDTARAKGRWRDPYLQKGWLLLDSRFTRLFLARDETTSTWASKSRVKKSDERCFSPFSTELFFVLFGRCFPPPNEQTFLSSLLGSLSPAGEGGRGAVTGKQRASYRGRESRKLSSRAVLCKSSLSWLSSLRALLPTFYKLCRRSSRFQSRGAS